MDLGEAVLAADFTAPSTVGLTLLEIVRGLLAAAADWYFFADYVWTVARRNDLEGHEWERRHDLDGTCGLLILTMRIMRPLC